MKNRINPKVSVIIPVFNREDLVVATIKSILLQTFENWELLLVDDGSTDNTIEVLKEFEKIEPRIKIFERQRLPKGPSTCKNIGADKASGNYLIFWDSDDIMAPWCLEERIGFLENKPKMDFAFFQLIDFGGKDDKLWLRCNFSAEESDIEKYINFKHGGSTQTVAWRKESFIKTGGWNEEMILWEDAEIHLRSIFNGLNYTHSNLPDGFLRNENHPGRLTSDENAKEKIKSAILFFEAVFPSLSDNQKEKLRENIFYKIWGRSYFLSLKEIKEIASLGLMKGLLDSKSFQNYRNYFFIYSFVKRIPFIRRPFYLWKTKKKNVSSLVNNDPAHLIPVIKKKVFELPDSKKEKFLTILPDSLRNLLFEN